MMQARIYIQMNPSALSCSLTFSNAWMHQRCHHLNGLKYGIRRALNSDAEQTKDLLWIALVVLPYSKDLLVDLPVDRKMLMLVLDTHNLMLETHNLMLETHNPMLETHNLGCCRRNPLQRGGKGKTCSTSVFETTMPEVEAESFGGRGRAEGLE